LAALQVKGRFSVPSRFGHISLSNQSIEASTTWSLGTDPYSVFQ